LFWGLVVTEGIGEPFIQIYKMGKMIVFLKNKPKKIDFSSKNFKNTDRNIDKLKYRKKRVLTTSKK
jgi:hypothetical protein